MSPKNDSPGEYKGIWVYVEQKHGAPARVSLELLGKAHSLAQMLMVEVTAMLMGEGLANQGEELIYYGADRVIIADDPIFKDYRTEVYSAVIVSQVLRKKPEILLVGATCTGRDLYPRVAARLRTGCIADCTELGVDQEMRLMIASKPYFGRNVMADIICPLHKPQIATIRPGVFELPIQNRTRKGEIICAEEHVKEEDVKVKVLDTVSLHVNGAHLEQAKKIVAGGMGVGKAEGFTLLKELADLLGAELGSTSLPVDVGWVSPERKIGQTGKTVSPQLYVACGISGAIQHFAGMKNSEFILAINKDPKAEIFNFADYAIVDDLYKVVPVLIQELTKSQAK
ncbi:MAG: electron transfer flavoprotein subunit alpha/FixB family protein [Candidatus Methanomethylicus sp.]|nr:electron transfer flavoprotein subunit alpha/FixB family protein [Candidatus Methanomethylicus sp.]